VDKNLPIYIGILIVLLVIGYLHRRRHHLHRMFRRREPYVFTPPKHPHKPHAPAHHMAHHAAPHHEKRDDEQEED